MRSTGEGVEDPVRPHSFSTVTSEDDRRVEPIGLENSQQPPTTELASPPLRLDLTALPAPIWPATTTKQTKLAVVALADELMPPSHRPQSKRPATTSALADKLPFLSAHPQPQPQHRDFAISDVLSGGLDDRLNGLQEAISHDPRQIGKCHSPP
jgi:hypothetical protein